MSRSQHLLLIGCLVLFSVVLHRAPLFAPGPLVDEEFYEAGFTALAESGSSYSAEGFMYPPTFAAAGLWLQQHLGVVRARVAVRWLNFSCLIFLLWFSVRCLADALENTKGAPNVGNRTLILLALVLTLLPGVRQGMYVGNISSTIGMMILLGVLSADRRPWLAGLLLGGSLLLKPLAAGALPLLLLPVRPIHPGAKHQPGAWQLRPNRWLAAAVAGSSALLLLLPFRSQMAQMLAADLTSMAEHRSLSFYRVSRLLGLGEQRVVIFAVATGLLCWFCWGRLGSKRALMVGTLAAIPLTTLAVWSHTLILFLPVAALAVATLINRRGTTGPGSVWSFFSRQTDSRHRLEIVAVLGSVAALYLIHGGDLRLLPPAVQILLLLPPLVAPAVLMIYWLQINQEEVFTTGSAPETD